MRADQTAARFADVRSEGGHIDERGNLRIAPCLGNGHPTPAVTDEDDRPRSVRDDSFRRSSVFLDGGQRNLRRNDRHPP